ncbi:hypothetical protein CCR75_005525 [Bremia lactucae]|uniref:Uncharacterized protein n=1 Tax=Bremia lactucae TaxID=4779 RepID=A0A976FGA3_BRELC|nr:hypothetical protein CCR75_005525 [Bremia lactucae]
MWLALCPEWPGTAKSAFPHAYCTTDEWVHTVQSDPAQLLEHVGHFAFPGELLANLVGRPRP